MPDTPAEPDTSPSLLPELGSGEMEAVETPWPGLTTRDLDTPSVGSVLDFEELGTFKLEACLGRGGMGEVYKARQIGAQGFSQPVAIKRLRPGRRDWEERSFVDEARVLSMLHHENIARVYGFFELKGSAYLVMEYIEGQTLHSLLEEARRKGHRFSEQAAREIAAEIAEALHYAHGVSDEAGRPLHLVHRDVSPTNILITRTGRAKLLDFGVAYSKLDGRTETASTSTIIKGKPPYLSPEQVRRLPVDARSDLFSLGTILVEILAGEAPFGWTADYTTLKRIVEVTPKYVASVTLGFDKKLRAICQKLLARDPDQRFASGRELALALRRHANAHEGPACVQAEVEKLKSLPEDSAAAAASSALREVRRRLLTVTLGGAVVLGALAFASFFAPRRTPSFPEDPTMSLSSQPESASTSLQSASRSCFKALALAQVLTIAACQAHSPTGVSLNLCRKEPVNVMRNDRGQWVELPREFFVDFVSLNGEKCTGKPIEWGEILPNKLGPLDEGQREPCPFGVGEVVARMSPRDDRVAHFRPIQVGPRARQRPLLVGRSYIVPNPPHLEGGFEILKEPAYTEHTRVSKSRMMVLFTELQMVNGITVDICGVLSWHDGKEGIPILDAEYYGRPVAADWGYGSFVRLYTPP